MAKVSQLPPLPGLTEGEPLTGPGDSAQFRCLDSVTGVARLVKVGPEDQLAGEAAALGRLADVCGVTHLVGQHRLGSGQTALVSELAEGLGGDRAVAQRLPWGPALRIGLALAKILGAVHAKQIAHGGVRPANLVLGTQGPVLTGFGAAVPVGAPYRAPADQAAWAPPEASSGQATASPGDDVYALAGLVRALIQGPSPVGGFQDQALPEALSEVLDRAQAVEPAARYATMAGFSAALAAVLAGGRPAAAPAPAVEPTGSPAPTHLDKLNRGGLSPAAAASSPVPPALTTPANSPLQASSAAPPPPALSMPLPPGVAVSPLVGLAPPVGPVAAPIPATAPVLAGAPPPPEQSSIRP
ncbi:MAG: hypothetical protein LBU05_01640, partial [Bifidobacteriaceae bacterium]|nr:hypothetical protein [Bifidobacteriaceae bacterium]